MRRNEWHFLPKTLEGVRHPLNTLEVKGDAAYGFRHELLQWRPLHSFKADQLRKLHLYAKHGLSLHLLPTTLVDLSLRVGECGFWEILDQLCNPNCLPNLKQAPTITVDLDRITSLTAAGRPSSSCHNASTPSKRHQSSGNEIWTVSACARSSGTRLHASSPRGRGLKHHLVIVAHGSTPLRLSSTRTASISTSRTARIQRTTIMTSSLPMRRSML